MGLIGKVLVCLMAAFLATIAAAGLAYNSKSQSGSESTHQPWTQNKMEFVAWNGERWTAWIRDDAFEQIPQNERRWNRHSKASLAFTDWKGEFWQAKIEDREFLLAHRGDWQGTIERSTALRYRDWEGNNQLRTVEQLRR